MFEFVSLHFFHQNFINQQYKFLVNQNNHFKADRNWQRTTRCTKKENTQKNAEFLLHCNQ